jgi:hypothetical protein
LTMAKVRGAEKGWALERFIETPLYKKRGIQIVPDFYVGVECFDSNDSDYESVAEESKPSLPMKLGKPGSFASEMR